MKAKLFGVILSLILALAAVIPAYAGATVTTVTNPLNFEFPFTDTCTGELLLAKISGEETLRIVDNNSGQYYGTYMIRSTVEYSNPDNGEVLFYGTVNWNDSFSFDSETGDVTRETEIRTGNTIRPGPENNIMVHLVTHISPNGVSFVKGELHTCR